MDNYESTAKTDSIRYIDGTNINTRTQYKITYYFANWLFDNNLLSDDPSGTSVLSCIGFVLLDIFMILILSFILP